MYTHHNTKFAFIFWDLNYLGTRVFKINFQKQLEIKEIYKTTVLINH